MERKSWDTGYFSLPHTFSWYILPRFFCTENVWELHFLSSLSYLCAYKFVSWGTKATLPAQIERNVPEKQWGKYICTGPLLTIRRNAQVQKSLYDSLNTFVWELFIQINLENIRIRIGRDCLILKLSHRVWKMDQYVPHSL